jgi:beta-1,4-N-acetylglucosaminyltransferase
MNQNKKKTVLVTLGTTKFEDFIKKMDSEEILEVLKSFGYNKIVFQIGKGEYEPSNYKKVKDIEVEVFRLKPSLIDDIKAADIVISHCGNDIDHWITFKGLVHCWNA